MHDRALTAGILAVAAVYQLTPLKHRCLRVCRAPLARILHGWRDGATGAFRMGVVNGLWCVGCCLGLTLALLALGMMSIGWMIAVARCNRDREDDAGRRRREPRDGGRARTGSDLMVDLSFRVRGDYFESCNCEARRTYGFGEG